MAQLKIDNPTARALWLSSHGLAQTPTGPLDTLELIQHLGFVQLDTIQVVSRAHHHILWSRNQNYREPQLDPLLRNTRQVFEHFTHDASVLPMAFLPLWQRQFQRMQQRVARSSWYGKHLDPDLIAQVTRRVREEGPLSTQDFNTQVEGAKTMWKRPPHKMVLDYLWYSGVLATSHRVGFTKVYDLAERVFPQDLPQLSDDAQINGLCTAALDRLGFGTAGEIRKFWDACDAPEVKTWLERENAPLVEVELQGADGSWSNAFACPDIEARIAALRDPTSRLRILNPFDPAIRDRSRLSRLFGFDYTVEMFVPAAKRKWGYYIYPLLEGGRFVGRAEIKGDRRAGTLTLSKLWFESARLDTAKRRQKLAAELTRLARLAELQQVIWLA
ncbi:winged helix-turn-helix domain-containing protein [Epibacterium sp. SM1969]|uniref:Winged helix-turn-helix domain-containing protein n=1 Tax=Tritonibacter aquimaris TaxID=2663379 RepID=A0A844B2M7_9RHOB|nr:crosslink repair DNA glycosylase YcaQ family protein [Tritonibacter aquimaris]MQY43626.1 winged helix-turn-helix domain-containing protein [Tritonibacter aquimaris]